MLHPWFVLRRPGSGRFGSTWSGLCWSDLRRSGRRFLRLGAIALLLWLSTAWPIQPQVAQAAPRADQHDAGKTAGRSIAIEAPGNGSGQDLDFDLERATEQVERASDEIYQGLDRTKDLIGKTEPRKEAIEHGRDHARERLESLAEKARAAQERGDPLSPKEELLLQRYEETGSGS
ncbi:MAG: hypothetical protein VKK04_14470 [Synechococcales bacterium]|nr:hypothetical protein [Synechococcales bacterium]